MERPIAEAWPPTSVPPMVHLSDLSAGQLAFFQGSQRWWLQFRRAPGGGQMSPPYNASHHGSLVSCLLESKVAPSTPPLQGKPVLPCDICASPAGLSQAGMWRRYLCANCPCAKCCHFHYGRNGFKRWFLFLMENGEKLEGKPTGSLAFIKTTKID